MLREILVLIALVGLAVMSLGAGCSASTVATSDSLGGVRDGPRWAIFSYLLGGSAEFSKSVQDDARVKMEAYCKPETYRVVSLDQKDRTYFNRYQGFGSGGSQQRLYIKIECVPR